MRGFASSIFEITAFCWLPPERLAIGSSGLAALMRMRLIASSMTPNSSASLIRPAELKRCSTASVML